MNTTIVTAFYDLGRGDWEGEANGQQIAPYIKRTTDTYFERFERLCKIANPIVCFTESKYEERIKAIRSDINVIAIDDVFENHQEVMDLIEKAQKNQEFISLVKSPASPEYWSPKYVAINFFKSFFVAYAQEMRLIKTPNAAWIDFGYCREKLFEDGFEWNFDTNDKINLFNIKPLDDTPIFSIVRSGDVYIQGCHIVAPAFRWKELKVHMIESLRRLLSVGFIDDDQTMLLMSYRMYPEIYKLNYVDPSDWFVAFKRS